MLWSGLISFTHVLGEFAYGLIADLTHRSLACKVHLNMSIENALYKFITITFTITMTLRWMAGYTRETKNKIQITKSLFNRAYSSSEVSSLRFVP